MNIIHYRELIFWIKISAVIFSIFLLPIMVYGATVLILLFAHIFMGLYSQHIKIKKEVS